MGNSCQIEEKTVTLFKAAPIRKYDLEEHNPVQSDHDNCDSLHFTVLFDYKEATILDTAGYLAKAVDKKLSCHECCDALRLPNYGNLYKPSPIVIQNMQGD